MSDSIKKLRIAIFGASSQVGSSVAFYLQKFTPHEPICFIRSKYSAVFFEIAKIKVIEADVENSIQLKEHLKDIDIVIDFSYPAGEIFEMPAMVRRNIKSIVSSISPNASFIYISSITAYGTPMDEKKLKSYYIPRSSYGYIKRKGERIARATGRKYKIPIYSFRLGQVHGFLQSVSESFRDKLSSNKYAYLDGKENDLTNTIFISSLSEAIIKCGLGSVKPSTYTLISNPQWSLKSLYDFYLRFFHLDCKIFFIPKEAKKFSIRTKLYDVIKGYRPLIESYLLTHLPSTSIKSKGRYRVAEIGREVASKNIKYLNYNLLGKPAIPVIEGLNSFPEDVFSLERKMQELYWKLINETGPTLPDADKNPQLSVIIPTYNREASLEKLLDSLFTQKNVSLEIIVVDQNEPGFFKGSLAKKLLQVTTIYLSTPNASLARNIGFTKSTAPFILFIDDDLLPEPDFCSKGLSVFGEFSLIKCFVPLIYPEYGKELAFSYAKRKQLKNYPENSEIFSVSDNISAAVFFERSYFELSGGFDIYLFEFAKASEDMELFLRMRKRKMTLWFVPMLEIFHDEKVEGGCELRTSDYWITRKKNARAMAFRYMVQNKNAGDLSVKDLLRIIHSSFLNKKALQSGVKNVIKEIKLMIESISDSRKFYKEYINFYKMTPVNFFEKIDAYNISIKK